MDELTKLVIEATRVAKRRAEEQGGSFQGWLWHLLRPPAFIIRGGEVVVEYPNLNCTLIRRYRINTNSNKIVFEEVEVSYIPADWGGYERRERLLVREEINLSG